MREEFEKWLKQNLNFNDTNLWKDNNGDYGWSIISIYWKAYQAGYRQCEDHKKGIR